MKLFLLSIFLFTISIFVEAQNIEHLTNTTWTKNGIKPKPTIILNNPVLGQAKTFGISFTDSVFSWVEENPVEYKNIKMEDPIFYYAVKKLLSENSEEIEVWSIYKKKKVNSFILKITFLSAGKIEVVGNMIATRKHKIILQRI
jgi:hypothetical protein